MDVKYIGGDVPWTLPFGDHFYSPSQASFTDTHKNNFTSTSDLDIIARRHGFEPLYTTNETRSQTKLPNSNHNSQWMNAGVLFTDKTIKSDSTGIHKTDFFDNHGHTFCYLCSINQHHHEPTKPRDQSQRRKLIPYNNPKALKARSSSLDRINQDSSASNSVPYQFVVRTGTRKNSGTRAQVFLYMYGTENNWTSINLHARTNPKSDGFPSGSIRTFCLKGPEIGNLRHLNVNLIGARSDKEWFLKEIEITNLHTSVMWLCEFNCWLPKKDEQEYQEIKPTIHRDSELSFDNLSVYILQVRTGGKRFAGTDSTIQVMINGSKSQTRRLPLTSDRADLFEQNQLDTFAIVGWDIGNLLEITVESDKSQRAADWDLKEMIMWKIIPSDDHKQVQVYFPFNDWLGKKTSTLKAKKDSYSPPDYHPRGPTCYQVAVKTGKAVGAGTDANVFLIIYGKTGRTTINQLDNQLKNDFEQGTTSEFTIMDIDVGEIDRIKVWHDNSGIGAAWFLDSIIIRKKNSTCRQVTNIFIERLEEISKALYRQVREQIKKNHKIRLSSTKENDRRTSKLKDYDDLGSNRGILRSPIDKANSQKKVSFEKQNFDSQDGPMSIDTKRMKNMQKPIEQKHKKEDFSQYIETGHFDHQAFWISTHNYINKKWLIYSVEERNSFDLDETTRSLLLSDRLAISSKIKTTINEKDDDVYEFEANRWLAKDKNDGKLEVTLTPKSTKLSTYTNNELKTKLSSDKINDSKKKHIPSSASSSDFRHDKYDDEHPKRSSKFDLGPLEKSPRSLASLDRSPHDTLKSQYDDSRSSPRSQQNYSNTSKRQEEFPIDKYHRPSSRNTNDLNIPSTNERELSKRIPNEPPYHSRSAATSVIDTKSSSSLSNQYLKSSKYNNDPNSPSTNERELSKRIPNEPPYHSRSAATSVIDTKSSTLSNQYLKSPRFNNELTSPLSSNRDLSTKTLAEPTHRPKSAARSTLELSSTRTTRNQVYGSAYGTVPMDDD